MTLTDPMFTPEAQESLRRVRRRYKARATRRESGGGNWEMNPGGDPDERRRRRRRRRRGDGRERPDRDRTRRQGRRMFLSNGRVSVSVRYSPREVTLDNFGRKWEEITKDKTAKMFDTGLGIPTVSFSVELVYPDLRPVHKDIRMLKKLSQSKDTIRCVYSFLESGNWYVTGMTIASIRRNEKNQVVWAKVDISLTSAKEPLRRETPVERAKEDNDTAPTTNPVTPPYTIPDPTERVPTTPPTPTRTPRRPPRRRRRRDDTGSSGYDHDYYTPDPPKKKKKRRKRIPREERARNNPRRIPRNERADPRRERANPKSKRPRRKRKRRPPDTGSSGYDTDYYT